MPQRGYRLVTEGPPNKLFVAQRGNTEKLNLSPKGNICVPLIHIGAKQNPMANTYTQIHIQIVIAVKYRDALILPPWKERLHQYITGIVQNN